MTFIIGLYFISGSITYFGNDAFQWFNHILYLQRYQTINYEYIRAYPPGFVIFCTTMISFINDYYFIYYFLKFIPIFLNLINVFVIFELARSFFKSESLIFLSIAIYLSMNYLLFRYLIPVSSLLGTCSGFIFLLFIDLETPESKETGKKFKNSFFKNLKNRDNILKGFLIFVIFMTQPFYSFIYFSLYILFEIYLYISRRKLNEKTSFKLNVHFSAYFAKILSFSLIVLLIIFPYILGLSLYLDYLILETYIRYAIPEFDISLYNNFLPIIPAINLLTDLNSRNINFFSPFLDIYFQTIDYGLIFIIIGIFIPLKKIKSFNEKQKNVFRFVKLSFILTLLLFFILYFMQFSQIGIIKTTYLFLEEYSFRILELFSGFWVLLFVLVFKYLFDLSKNYFSTRGNIKTFQKCNLKTIPLILVIILGGYFYFINFIRVTPNLYFEEEETRALQYVGNYFYNNPVNENTTIFLKDIDNKHIYDLIMDKNIKKEYLNFSLFTNYTQFKYNVSSIKNNKYIFFKSTEFSLNILTSFINNIDIIYQDKNGFIFAKLKIHSNLKITT